MSTPHCYPDGCSGPPDADPVCTHCEEACRPIREACVEGNDHCASCGFAVTDELTCAEWCGANEWSEADLKEAM